MRKRWIQVDGELIPAEQTTNPGRTPQGPAIITDSTEPFMSQADGRMYTSKSAYRRDLVARGYREVGNDDLSRTAEKPGDGDIRRDIEQAIEGTA